MKYGTVYKFGNNINTDDIIAGKYKHTTMNLDELTKHIMENISPDFHTKIRAGDYIVAGENFGCGSSREQAPQIIFHAGIHAVIAKSFARIFLRNAINIGLLILTCNTDTINEGDELELLLEKGVINDLSNGQQIKIETLSEDLQSIIKHGGLINCVLKGEFK